MLRINYLSCTRNNQFKTKDICRVVIMLDGEDGLCDWDNCEAESLEAAIDIIDGGFGILPLVG